MRRIKIKAKNVDYSIRQWQLFLFFFIALLLIHLSNLHITISVDGYYRIFTDVTSAELSTGRILSFAIESLFEFLHISLIYSQQIFFLCFLIMLSIAACLLVNTIVESLKKLRPIIFISVLLAVLLSFANVIFQEYFYFSEAYFLWGVGTLLWALSLRAFFVLPNKRGLFVSFLLLFCAVSTYQVWLQPFIVWGLAILIIKYRKLDKPLFIRSLKICLIGLISMVLNQIVTTILTTTIVTYVPRGFSFSGILENLLLELRMIKYSLLSFPTDTYSIFFVAILALSILIIISILVHTFKHKAKRVLLLIIYLAISWLVIFGMHLFEADPTISMRTLSGLGFLVACLFLLLTLQVDKGKWQKLVLSILVIFIIINIYQLQSITTNTILSNRLDEREAKAIEGAITSYEEQSGIKVTRMVKTFDDSPTAIYPEVSSPQNLILRSAFVEWSFSSAIRFYTGRTFEEVSTDLDAHSRIFDGMNWDSFNPAEQLYFVGDTVYYCVY